MSYKKPPTSGGGSEQQRTYWLWLKYGLTPELVEDMVSAQRGLCAICGERMKNTTN